MLINIQGGTEPHESLTIHYQYQRRASGSRVRDLEIWAGRIMHVSCAGNSCYACNGDVTRSWIPDRPLQVQRISPSQSSWLGSLRSFLEKKQSLHTKIKWRSIVHLYFIGWVFS